MINMVSLALSGLMAASKKAAIAADNIVNSDSDSFNARDVTTSAGPGGVQSNIILRTPAVFQRYEPDSPYANNKGIVMKPNVDITEELINIEEAKFAYTANAVVMARVKALQDALKDNQPVSFVDQRA